LGGVWQESSKDISGDRFLNHTEMAGFGRLSYNETVKKLPPQNY
jgi:hypothetical protein